MANFGFAAPRGGRIARVRRLISDWRSAATGDVADCGFQSRRAAGMTASARTGLAGAACAKSRSRESRPTKAPCLAPRVERGLHAAYHAKRGGAAVVADVTSDRVDLPYGRPLATPLSGCPWSARECQRSIQIAPNLLNARNRLADRLQKCERCRRTYESVWSWPAEPDMPERASA